MAGGGEKTRQNIFGERTVQGATGGSRPFGVSFFLFRDDPVPISKSEGYVLTARTRHVGELDERQLISICVLSSHTNTQSRAHNPNTYVKNNLTMIANPVEKSSHGRSISWGQNCVLLLGQQPRKQCAETRGSLWFRGSQPTVSQLFNFLGSPVVPIASIFCSSVGTEDFYPGTEPVADS